MFVTITYPPALVTEQEMLQGPNGAAAKQELLAIGAHELKLPIARFPRIGAGKFTTPVSSRDTCRTK